MIEVVVHCDFAWGTHYLDAGKLRIGVRKSFFVLKASVCKSACV